MQVQSLSLVAPSRGLEQLIAKTKSFIHGANSPATLRAYRSDFEDFTAFCREHDLSHLPTTPGTVALYISDRADSLAAATISRRLTSITKAHQAAGFEDSPASTHHFIVGETLKGIRRAIGTRQHCKDPLLTVDIRGIVRHCPISLLGTRDRALILVGFDGAFRRRSSRPSKSGICPSHRTESSSTCVGRKPTRREPAERSAFLLDRTS